MSCLENLLEFMKYKKKQCNLKQKAETNFQKTKKHEKSGTL